MRNLVLIGYRCCGKSSVGRSLALRLKRPFWDTDALVEARAGMPIGSLVAAGGWGRFREAEGLVIASLSALGRGVIATGGGSLESPRNRSLLGANGLFVWLRADLGLLEARLAGDRSRAARPALVAGLAPETEVQVVYARREPIYRRMAQMVIDTDDKGIDALTDEIVARLRRTGALGGPLPPQEMAHGR